MPPKKATTHKDKDDNSKQKFRNFCATVNNYTPECLIAMEAFIKDNCTYGVYGKEVGESGTPHLQVYCELKGRLSLASIRKKTTPKIANIQPRFSDLPKEAAGYCKKGNIRDVDKPEAGWIVFFDTAAPDFDGFEFGKDDISCPGTRTDLKAAAEQIKKGEKSIRDLRNDNPLLYHQYGRTLHELENDYHRSKFRLGEMTTCTWLHGLPGRGKSHQAFLDECECVGGYHPDKVYDWDLEQEFQCGYEGQELVIINEYKGPHQIKYGTLLKLIDKWPMKIKRKNPLAAREFVSKHIVIASVFHPTEIQWNLHSTDDLDQLLDRITVKKVEGENRRK